MLSLLISRTENLLHTCVAPLVQAGLRRLQEKKGPASCNHGRGPPDASIGQPPQERPSSSDQRGKIGGDQRRTAAVVQGPPQDPCDRLVRWRLSAMHGSSSVPARPPSCFVDDRFLESQRRSGRYLGWTEVAPSSPTAATPLPADVVRRQDG